MGLHTDILHTQMLESNKPVHISCQWPAGIGGLIAVILSVILNHSFWWGLFHFFCGWFYVLYVFTARYKDIAKVFGW